MITQHYVLIVITTPMHLVCNLICNLINMLNTIVDRGPPMEHVGIDLGISNPSPEAFAERLSGF